MAVRITLPIWLALLAAGCGGGRGPGGGDLPPAPTLATNAPADQPVQATGAAASAEYAAAIAPYVAEGRRTYPGAKTRYLAGLPAGHHFFAVTNLRDGSGAAEQVFIAVARIQGDRVAGRIASMVLGVQGFREGDPYEFSEAELVDWMIARPDGSEEGNVVGKFLDEWQKTRRR